MARSSGTPPGLADRVATVDGSIDVHSPVRRRADPGSPAVVRLDPEVVAQLLGASRRRDVLQQVAAVLSNAGIAEASVVCDRAVEKHIADVFQKVDLPPSETHNRRVLAVLRHLQS